MKITKSQLASKFNTDISKIDYCIELLKTEFSKNTCDKCENSSMIFLPKDSVDEFHFCELTLSHSTPMTIYPCNKAGHLIRDNQCIRNTHSEVNSITKYLKSNNSLENCGIFLYNTPCMHCATLLYSLGIKYYIILNKKDEDSKLYTIMNSTDKQCIDNSKLVTEIYYIG